MSKNKIYLDNAAATPVFPEVLEVITDISKENFGNPSSVHSYGNESAELINSSRKTISNFLNCKSTEVYFTSSGTESNNLALMGVAKANRNKGNHIITTNIEHPSILNACKSLEKEGFDITYIKVGTDGLIKMEQLKKAIKKETILVSVHLANSEIGVIQPVYDISYTAKKHNIYFHVDACQATAYLDLNVDKLGVDLLTLNSSKAYGPKGVAALYVKDGTEIFPIHFGGGQQQGLRSGTENVSGIVGFAKSLEIISHRCKEESKRILKLRNNLEIEMEKGGAKINVKNSPRLPNHLSIILPIDEPNLVKYFDDKGIAVSAGSACSSRSLSDSYVLRAIGLNSKQIHKTIRISLGYYTLENIIYPLNNIIKKGARSL